jgi:hypothetical protein
MQALSDFYETIAGINFTLLGFWWVAVQELNHLRSRRTGRAGGMAYAISLQFLIPGAAALTSQVAPEVPVLWRLAFTSAGVLGAVGIILTAPTLLNGGSRTAAWVLLALGVPLYTLVAAVAAVPPLADALGGSLSSAQWEGVLFCLVILIGTQTAWTAAMSKPLGASESG